MDRDLVGLANQVRAVLPVPGGRLATLVQIGPSDLRILLFDAEGRPVAHRDVHIPFSEHLTQTLARHGDAVAVQRLDRTDPSETIHALPLDPATPVPADPDVASVPVCTAPGEPDLVTLAVVDVRLTEGRFGRMPWLHHVDGDAGCLQAVQTSWITLSATARVGSRRSASTRTKAGSSASAARGVARTTHAEREPSPRCGPQGAAVTRAATTFSAWSRFAK